MAVPQYFLWKRSLYPVFTCVYQEFKLSFLKPYFRTAFYISYTLVALVIKNLSANLGDLRDAGSIPGWGRSSGGGHGNPLQYPCLENPMDREAWQAKVHVVTKSQTRPKWLSMALHFHELHSFTVLFDLQNQLVRMVRQELGWWKWGRWMMMYLGSPS